MTKTPRAFVQQDAKKKAKRSALGEPVLLQGTRLSDYKKLSPLRIGSDDGPMTLKKLTLPKKPRP